MPTYGATDAMLSCSATQDWHTSGGRVCAQAQAAASPPPAMVSLAGNELGCGMNTGFAADYCSAVYEYHTVMR